MTRGTRILLNAFIVLNHPPYDGSDVARKMQARCGPQKSKPYFARTREAAMDELADWVEDADRLLTG